MSYILDALKKSEAQRHAGKIPTVVAPQGVQIESARASRARLFVWIALALAVALAAGWWARQFIYHPERDAAASPADRGAPATDAGNAVVPPASARSGEAIPRLKLASSLPARETPVTAPAAEPAKPAAQPAVQPVTQAARTPAAPPPAHDAPAPAAARGAVVPYANLPPAIRQSLPPLVVGGFAAGESGGTMVMVDDKLVREGDEVAPGIRVEKILVNGAEFAYKGYRFRR